MTQLYKGKEVAKGKESEYREKPGQGSAGKYKNLPKGEFAGPHGTFPINTEARARNALARAHFSPNPEKIKNKVYKEYPDLKKRHEERQPKKDANRINLGRPHTELGHMGVEHKEKPDARKNDKRYQAYKSR